MQSKSWEKVLFLALGLYAIGSFISMAVMSLSMGIFLLSVVLYSVWNPSFWKTLRGLSFLKPYLVLTGGMFFFALLSRLVAQWFPLEFSGETHLRDSYRDFFKWGLFLVPIFLVSVLLTISKPFQKKVFQIWLITACVLGLIGIQQIFTGWPRVAGLAQMPGFYTPILFLGHHLSVSNILIFPFFILLGLFFSEKSIRNKFMKGNRFWIGGGGMGLAVVLFFTFSRMLWVALAVGMCLYLLLSISKTKQKLYFLLALLAIGVGALSFAPVRARLLSANGTTDRFQLWKANLVFFQKRPWTGVGWRNNEPLSGVYLKKKLHREHVFAGHAHNNFLEVLAGMGIFGFLMWVFWNLWVAKQAWELRKRKKFKKLALALFCVWIVFHLNGLTQVNFWESKVIHSMMWFLSWLLFWRETQFQDVSD